MEDTLGVWIKYSRIILLGVLILVLMEDTLEDKTSKATRVWKSPNPCSNGRYSRRVRGVKALFQAGGE